MAPSRPNSGPRAACPWSGSSLGSAATETITYGNTSATATVFYMKVIAYSSSSTTTPYNLALTR